MIHLQAYLDLDKEQGQFCYLKGLSSFTSIFPSLGSGTPESAIRGGVGVKAGPLNWWHLLTWKG